ncbi:MAG: hypothetical protein JWL85_413, partial [Candidatus Saccharibacteria bacterium]|nr:hypothetical protein [Candidatus Saccharibacteria bacterium]
KVGESEAPSHYLTVQKIHGKKLLNSTLPSSPQERLRYSIKDLTDPQTLPILRYLGVDAIEIHGIPKEVLDTIPGITVLRYDHYKSPITGGHIAIAKINDGPSQDHVLVLEKKFPLNGTIMKSAIEVEFETEQDATMAVRDVIKDSKDSVQKICFEVKTADPVDVDELAIKKGSETIVGPIRIDGSYSYVEFTLPEDQTVTLHNKSGHNMRINSLGCR